MIKKLIVVMLMFAFAQVSAQKSIWHKLSSPEKEVISNTKKSKKSSYGDIYELDLDLFRQVLLSATGEQAKSTTVGIPTKSGKTEEYHIWEYSNFSPELQVQFPQIRAYKGYAVKHPANTIAISLSPAGIKAMVLTADKQTKFIEPITKDGLFYEIIESDSQKRDEPFKCLTNDINTVNDKLLNNNKLFSNTQLFRTFRLALSCTAEYTAYFGGTIAGALGGMNATLTRVNAIFDKDLSIKVELIPATTSLIYTDPATDPYSIANTGAGGAWSLELQNNLTATIGNDAYDIGHLFGASGGGGNAGCIGCVCINPNSTEPQGKGSAFTSPAGSQPEGDAFDVDYVAHEIGHQLGANHTFSFRIEGTGVNVEPGSGSTIMGYAGITDFNVQKNSDDYFTYKSILQIQTNLADKTCPIITPLNNTPPTVSAGPDYIIPQGTAFILTGTGSDAETNSALTYIWEQNDTADNSVTGSASVAFLTKLKGPNFRSIAPSASPIRYLPALKTIVTNNLTNPYESVSTVARTLNFVLTGRDNSMNGAQTNSDATVINVVTTAGPSTLHRKILMVFHGFREQHKQ